MTREHKLSLIVGFSIVLLVAVLISDHFSSAQQQSLGLAEAEEAAAAATTTPPRPLQAPTPTGRGPSPQLAMAPTQPTRNALTDPITRVMPEPTAQPQKLVINQGSRTMPALSANPTMPASPMPRVGGSATPAGDGSLIAQGREALESLRERIQKNGMEYLQDAPVAAEVGTRPIAGDASATRTPNVRLSEGTPVNRPTTNEAPSRTTRATPTRLHVVQEGESLYRIAERFYGDGNLWRKLAAHNTDRVADNGSVRVGVTLKIPEAAALGVSTPPSTRAAKNTQATRRTASQTAPKPAATRTYIVRKGDTLGAICSRELGSSKRMDDVIALNPKLESADMIYVGMKLTLPGK